MTTPSSFVSPDTDALLREVGSGSTSAFAALYDVAAPLVFGVCTAALTDPDAAERATEVAFIDVWRQAAGYRTSRSDATRWILAITDRAIARQRVTERSATV